MVAKRTSRYRGPVGSGNPTGVNSSSACLRTPREIHISDSVAYFTGVAKSDRIGGDHLDLLNRGHTIPLGFGNSLSRYPIKLHQLTTRVELFYFVCRMKLVLSHDVGRWSRILRVWEIVKNKDLTPNAMLFHWGSAIPKKGFQKASPAQC